MKRRLLSELRLEPSDSVVQHALFHSDLPIHHRDYDVAQIGRTVFLHHDHLAIKQPGVRYRIPFDPGQKRAVRLPHQIVGDGEHFEVVIRNRLTQDGATRRVSTRRNLNQCGQDDCIRPGAVIEIDQWDGQLTARASRQDPTKTSNWMPNQLSRPASNNVEKEVD